MGGAQYRSGQHQVQLKGGPRLIPKALSEITPLSELRTWGGNCPNQVHVNAPINDSYLGAAGEERLRDIYYPQITYQNSSLIITMEYTRPEPHQSSYSMRLAQT